MRLKNIKLAGFKSFVDPTNVQLTTNLVAVVGPNGCGKSNIIDAVRWVMGESSAKNLRGESMADVIFNGSTARKPVGQASIELVFDNTEGRLKGEYAAFTEISIKRKVTRDGQSSYYLNGTKCRRRDITDIFLGTGLGPRSYAIIEQGMISRLIESKPEELRVFIEEAAGISKYKERRRETETRIRHTRENLERLTDLREELDRQLQKLKRQASAAEKYKEYKAEERELKAQTLSLQWQSLRDKSSGQRETIAKLEVDLEASIAEQRSVDANIEKLRETHVEKTDIFNNVQASYYGLGAEISRLEQSLEHCEQRAKQLTQDLEETESNAAESRQHLEDDKNKLELWSEELSTLEPQHLELAESETLSSNALQLSESNMHDWQHRWDEFNINAAEPQKNAEVQRNRIDQIEESLRGLSSRMERLNKELTELQEQDHSEQLSKQQVAITESEEALKAIDTTLQQSIDQLQHSRSKQKEAVSELNISRGQLQEQRGKYASLDALQKSAQSDNESTTQNWLQSQKLDKAPRLLEHLKVSHGWETAVETVLGDSLQAISVSALNDIVATVNDIDNANISFVENGYSDAKSEKRTDITLPTLASKISSGAPQGLLKNIYAAESLTLALTEKNKLSDDESIVTNDGMWLGSNWLRVLRNKNAKQGVLERQQQLEKLAEEINNTEQSIHLSEQMLEEAEASVVEAEKQKDSALQDKSKLQNLHGQAQSEIRNLQNNIEQAERRRKRVEDEVQHAELNQRNQREALTEARKELDEAIDSMAQAETERESLLLQRDQVRDALVQTRESAKTDRNALQEVAVKTESLKAQINSVASTVERLEKQVTQLAQREETLRQSQTENAQPMPELKTALTAQLASRVTVETELGEARKAVESIDLSLRESDQQRNQIEQSTQDIRSRLEQSRIDSQEMQVRTKTIEEQLEETGFEVHVVLKSLPEEAELDLWQTQLDDVSRKINRLGAINLAAIEEFKTESERKVYLDTQNEELESALSTLENAMQKIDKETRSLFKETFDALNNSLRDLFPKVFGGGAAYLEMTGDDLLNTGIAIMARPPGKRNSTIHLLSGGEKALTAIALVFSIFQLNPAPFCMLDEVDAPLDDANTARYARLIQEMSSKVQFIFITHNKITMEMSDHLMGVTMHEPGCSRLVSVDINEAVALATA